MPLILKLAAMASVGALALMIVCPAAGFFWGERALQRCLLAGLASSISALSLILVYVLCGPAFVNAGFELRMRLRNPQASAVTVDNIRRNPQKSAEPGLRPDKRWIFSAESIRRVRSNVERGTPWSGL